VTGGPVADEEGPRRLPPAKTLRTVGTTGCEPATGGRLGGVPAGHVTVTTVTALDDAQMREAIDEAGYQFTGRV